MSRFNPYYQQVKVTNGIKNGGFLNGYTDWANAFGTCSVANRILTCTSNGASSVRYQTNTTNIVIAAGKKIFIRVKYRTTSLNAQYLNIQIVGSEVPGSAINLYQLPPEKDEWYSINTVVTLPSDSSGYVRIRFCLSHETKELSLGQVMEIDGNYGAMCIDLSDTTGMGNATTSDDVVALINSTPDKWWDGTLTLNQNILMNWIINRSNLGNVLWGKKLGTAGDSITGGAVGDKSYGKLVADRNGMTFYNYGVSGSPLSNVVGKSPFCVDRYLAMAEELDYLTLWFGWNDYAYSTLGTISDNVDTTFFGAWNKVLPALIQKYPLCKIGLIVQYGTSADFRQAVRDIGAKWGLPVLDLYSNQVPLVHLRDGVDSTIQNFRRSTFTSDGTHPNQSGHNYISTFYENFLRSL